MGSPRMFRQDRDDPQAAAEAARALDAGELVVVPTETVYGIAAREDRPAARERLAAIKVGRTRRYSLAVPSLELLVDRLAPLQRPARRMAERWWPGPLTLVLPTRDGDTLGVRVPGHRWTRELLARVGAPVLLPSANRPGRPPPTSLLAVEREVLEQAAVAVDGGRTALGDASTVVRPGRLVHRVLREGVVSRDDLRRHAGTRVVVVCSGNTCRSPMAARLLARALERARQADPELLLPEVVSAGTATSGGSTASEGAVDALARYGVDLADHLSRAVDAELLGGADLVLVMTAGHRSAVAELLPAGGGVPVELFDPGGREVPDPFGGPLAVYEATAAALVAMADERARAMLAADA